MLMLMPMMMMLALTPMLMLDTFDDVAYAAANDVNADAKMPNVARHLSCWCICCAAAATFVADADVA